MTETGTKKVSIQHLLKVYQQSGHKTVTAVNDVSLEIAAGEFVTLLGPSGCGKTTILRMVAGFEVPTDGQVLIGADDVTNLTPDKRDTAMVFQSYALFPHLNVFDNIAYGLKIKRLPNNVIKEKVMEILALVGLGDLENRAPNQLSGGQQQRVALARALVMEPGVLLFDEPLSNLDAKLRIHMRAEIRRIQRKIGITSIYVTHDQAEAMSMSDRVIIMKQGKIEQIGTPHEIYAHPATEFVADFIGTANILDGTVGTVEGDVVQLNVLGATFRLTGTRPVLSGEAVRVVLRPEAVELRTSDGLSAEVLSSVFMGSYQDYRLRVGGQLLTMVDTNPGFKRVFREGEQAFVGIRPDSLHIVAK